MSIVQIQESEEYENIDDLESDYTQYIIYDSDSRYIDDSDLDALSQTDVQLARNEIFARHSRGGLRQSGLESISKVLIGTKNNTIRIISTIIL